MYIRWIDSREELPKEGEMFEGEKVTAVREREFENNRLNVRVFEMETVVNRGDYGLVTLRFFAVRNHDEVIRS